MKKTLKLTALLLSASVLPMLPVSAATAATDCIHADFGGIDLCWSPENGCWYDHMGTKLTDGTAPLQTALYEGVKYTVNLTDMQVTAPDGTVNDTLSALLPTYLAFRPLSVTGAHGWEGVVDGEYVTDLSETELFAEAERLAATIPLTYQFDDTVDDFCCRISLCEQVIGGMVYAIDAGDAPEPRPYQNEGGLEFRNLGKVPVTKPASESLWCWGTATGESFADMELLDDKGLFDWVSEEDYGNYQVYSEHYEGDSTHLVIDDPETGASHMEPYHYKHDAVYVVSPRRNTVRFVLKEGIANEEAEPQIEAILRKYYPDVLCGWSFDGTVLSELEAASDVYCTRWYRWLNSRDDYRAYDLWDKTGTQTAETAAKIMRDLAAAGLIDEFYTWGATANYQEVWMSDKLKWPANPDLDWDTVRAWLSENAPGCTLEHYEERSHNILYDEGYKLIQGDDVPFADYFRTLASLYEMFGLRGDHVCPESTMPELTGGNALLKAGDINLNCEIDLTDAVMLAKAVSGIDVGLTVTGRINAECDGEEGLTSGDLRVMLQYLAGCTDAV